MLNKNNSVSFKPSSIKFCQSCVFGKHIKLPFSNSVSATMLPFDIIHSDLWTSPVLSSNGHRYYMLLLNDYTNYLWTFPLINKSQVFSIFKDFHRLIQTKFERTIKCFQCDPHTSHPCIPFSLVLAPCIANGHIPSKYFTK